MIKLMVSALLFAAVAVAASPAARAATIPFEHVQCALGMLLGSDARCHTAQYVERHQPTYYRRHYGHRRGDRRVTTRRH